MDVFFLLCWSYDWDFGNDDDDDNDWLIMREESVCVWAAKVKSSNAFFNETKKQMRNSWNFISSDSKATAVIIST